MPNFGDEERRIKNLFIPGQAFLLNDKHFTILKSGKPTCQKGEPKTDIYVLARDTLCSCCEIKISFKKQNADFIENKTNSERAQQLLGVDWKNIIIRSTRVIEEAFNSKKLVYKRSSGKTEVGSITLGWKFELLNKTGGELSGKINLSQEQILDVYEGTNLSDDKKNAMVNGEVIANSGVANFVLMNDSVESLQQVIDSLISIEDYVKLHPKVYFACKALNYRTVANKWDGDRPLSVYVDWTVIDGKLKSELVFDNPLLVKGNVIAKKLISCLAELQITDISDLSEENIQNYNIVIE